MDLIVPHLLLYFYSLFYSLYGNIILFIFAFSRRTSGRYVTEDLSRISAVRSSLAEEQLEQFLGAMKKLGFEDREVTDLIERHRKEQHI